MKLIAAKLSAALVPLSMLLAACGGSTSNTPGPSPVPGSDGGVLPGDGAQVTSDGSVMPPPPPGIGANCQAVNTVVVHQGERTGWLPRIAWSNDQYGIAWLEEVKEGSTIKQQPAFARVGKDGQVLGTTTMLAAGPTAYNVGPATVAGLAQGFAVVWSDTRAGDGTKDLYLASIDDAGAQQAEVKVTDSGAAAYPYLVRPAFVAIEGPQDVKQLALAWRDGREHKSTPYPPYSEGRHDLYIKKINLDGSEAMAEKRLTGDESAKDPFWPVLAFDGTGYSLVWHDKPSLGSSELYFTMLGNDGTPTATETMLVENRGLLSSSPDLVATDREYGITYSENPDKDTGRIRFARLDKTGAEMATQQITSAGNPCTPAVAFNGERYAVVWQSDCGQEGSELLFALLDDGGNPLKADGTSCYGDADPRCGILTVSPDAQGTASFPEMISVGGKFAITWMNAPQDQILFTQVACSAN